MKRKYIVPIAITVAILLIALLIFIPKGDKQSESTDLSNTHIEVPDEFYDNMADNLGMSRDELDELLNTPLDLTPEQQEQLNELNTKDDAEEEMEEIPEITDEDIANFNEDFDEFIDKLMNGDIDDLVAPQLGNDGASTDTPDASTDTDTTDTPDNTEDSDTSDDLDDYDNSDNHDGYNGELEGTEDTTNIPSYWERMYGMTAEQISELPDEEKIALGFTQRSNGTWVDETGYMLPRN